MSKSNKFGVFQPKHQSVKLGFQQQVGFPKSVELRLEMSYFQTQFPTSIYQSYQHMQICHKHMILTPKMQFMSIKMIFYEEQQEHHMTFKMVFLLKIAQKHTLIRF